jgi:O-antigen/teichoic acid export membrane protein
VIARVLGTIGRGQFTAITLPPALVGWLFAMGCSQAASYQQARHPEDGGRILGTWLALLGPLSIAALLAGELLLPVLLAAQSGATLHLAQLYMLTVVPALLAELVYGVLLGDHDFLFYNLIRFGQPALTALAYLALWRLKLLRLETALLALMVPSLMGLAIAWSRAVRRHGLARPSRALARTTLWYGIRAHGTNVSGVLNMRLDLLVVPAFLAASSVGVYTVATTVSGVVMTLAASMSLLVLPMAARQGAAGIRTVVRLARATLLAGTVLAGVVAGLASVGVRIVYGAPFEAAFPIILLLLPGTVLYATAEVLRPALYAVNRPLAAAGSYALGVLVAVPALLLFLRPGGLVAAALISTVSHATVLVAILLAYRRITGVSLRQFAPARSDLALIRAAWRRLLSRPPQASPSEAP